jgi:CBS-domain-containing membrane protein
VGTLDAPGHDRSVAVDAEETTMLKIGMPALARGMRVSEVMTSHVTFLQTNETLDEAWQILHAKSISGAPVLDRHGQLVGIVSKADLADPRHHVGDVVGTVRTVRDIMTRVVYAVRAGDSVESAVRLMLDEDIHRAIVVNEKGSVAGIVTPMDVLRALVRGADIAGPNEDRVPLEFVDLREIP